MVDREAFPLDYGKPAKQGGRLAGVNGEMRGKTIDLPSDWTMLLRWPMSLSAFKNF